MTAIDCIILPTYRGNETWASLTTAALREFWPGHPPMVLEVGEASAPWLEVARRATARALVAGHDTAVLVLDDHALTGPMPPALIADAAAALDQYGHVSFRSYRLPTARKGETAPIVRPHDDGGCLTMGAWRLAALATFFGGVAAALPRAKWTAGSADAILHAGAVTPCGVLNPAVHRLPMPIHGALWAGRPDRYGYQRAYADKPHLLAMFKTAAGG